MHVNSNCNFDIFRYNCIFFREKNRQGVKIRSKIFYRFLFVRFTSLPLAIHTHTHTHSINLSTTDIAQICSSYFASMIDSPVQGCQNTIWGTFQWDLERFISISFASNIFRYINTDVTVSNLSVRGSQSYGLKNYFSIQPGIKLTVCVATVHLAVLAGEQLRRFRRRQRQQKVIAWQQGDIVLGRSLTVLHLVHKGSAFDIDTIHRERSAGLTFVPFKIFIESQQENYIVVIPKWWLLERQN